MPTGKNSKKGKVIIVDDSSDDLTNELAELDLNKETTEGYETDTEEAMPKEKKMRPRRRLLVGEADLSYARALAVMKHPEIANAVTATFYEKNAELKKTYPDTFSKNVKALSNANVSLFSQVNATQLHTYQLPYERYERIHFNCPHDGSDYRDQTLPPIIHNFFASAKNLQKKGDRIHIALPKPPEDEYNKFYKAYIYDVYNAARNAGYVLVEKRKFDAERFPGYQHRETKKNQSAAVTGNLREYIFKKTNLTPQQILDQNPKTKWTHKYNPSNWRHCLPEPETDNDSSDYLTTDSENEAAAAPTIPKLKAG